MNAPTDWISAIAILVAGLAVGAMLVFFFSKRRTRPLDTDLERKDLEAKRDALVAQLRAMPDDASDERARLEHETAQVLRTLDSRAPLPAARGEGARSAGEGQSPSAMNPTIKGFLWGAGSVAALVALGWFVSSKLEPRPPDQQTMPMQQAPVAQGQQQQPDPMIQQLESAVQRDPNNIALRNDLAQAWFERENLMAVFEQTKIVLEKNPDDSRALTFQALVRVAMGETDNALAMLQRATKSDPRNLDSWVALAWLHAQSNRMRDAEAAIAEAVKVSPNDRPKLEQVLQQMKSLAAQPPAQTAQLPPDHPPLTPAPGTPTPTGSGFAAPAGPAPAGKSVRITLQLDPAARARAGIVFVMARNPAGGPPIAAKRVMVQSFPITVDLGAADSMMGQQLPDVFRVEARLDSDGDAATRPATDPSARADGVSPGAAVTLALK